MLQSLALIPRGGLKLTASIMQYTYNTYITEFIVSHSNGHVQVHWSQSTLPGARETLAKIPEILFKRVRINLRDRAICERAAWHYREMHAAPLVAGKWKRQQPCAFSSGNFFHNESGRTVRHSTTVEWKTSPFHRLLYWTNLSFFLFFSSLFLPRFFSRQRAHRAHSREIVGNV